MYVAESENVWLPGITLLDWADIVKAEESGEWGGVRLGCDMSVGMCIP